MPDIDIVRRSAGGTGPWKTEPERTSSGGSQTTNLIRVPFSFDTSSLNVGVDVYAFAAGEYLLQAWIEVITAWDGTTPKGDFGFPDSSPLGILGGQSAVAPMDVQWQEVIGGTGALYIADAVQGYFPAAAQVGSTNAPLRFTTPQTLQVWVSRDGLSGGTATGGAAGAGAISLLVATPS